MTSRRGALVPVLFCLALSGCQTQQGSPTVAQPRSPADLSRCQQAPPEFVSQIDASFTDGQRLADAQSVTDGSMLYIAGNVINQAGKLDSPATVWVVHEGDAVYSASEAASSRSYMPDVRQVLGYDAYDSAGIVAQECLRN